MLAKKMNRLYGIVLGGIGLFVGTSVFAVHPNTMDVVTQNTMSSAYNCSPENTSRFALYEGDNFRLWDYFYPVEYQNGNNISLEGTWEIQNTTNINVYNPYRALGNTITANTLGGKLAPFYYMSNGRLGTRHFGGLGNGIANVLVSSQYAGVDYAIVSNPNPNRSQLAAQIMHNIKRKQVQQFCSWPYAGCPVDYTMTSFDLDDELTYSQRVRIKSYRGEEEGHTCQDFYIAKCGDGIVDIAGNAPGTPQDGEGGIQTDAGFVPWLLGDFQTEQCDDGNNISGDGCSASCQVEAPAPSHCEVEVEENSAYIYEDGSFDPNPVHVRYDIDNAPGTTLQSNIPGVQSNTIATVNITNNLQDHYYVRVLNAQGQQVAYCSDSIDLGSCGDNELQADYEQCEIDTTIMPADTMVDNLESLLPGYQNVSDSLLVGGVYAKLFSKKPVVKSESLQQIDSAVIQTKDDLHTQKFLRTDIPSVQRARPNDIKQPIPSTGDGCSATCQLEIPTCNVAVGPGEINAGERAYFSGQTQAWATFLTLDFDEGGPTYNFADSFPGGLPVSYFHFDSGVYYDGYTHPELGYSYVARVENARGMAGSWQLLNPNATLPWNICGGDTTVRQLDVEKSLIQEGVVFASGDDIGFQIVVTNNSSDWVHEIYVTDYFSPLLNWDGNIDIVGLGNNTVVTTGIIVGDPDLEWITVSNIDLAPMSSGVIYLTGRMYSDICDWPNTGVMTGDALTDPLWFGASFPCGPVADIQKYQSTGTAIDSFTQDPLSVEMGDSLNYRIEFSNLGGSTTHDVIVRDVLPEGIHYVGSEIFVYTGGSAVLPSPLFTHQGVVGNQDYIVYSGFDLDAGQTGYMMIYAEVSGSSNIFVYENTATVGFADPYQSGISNTVIAVRGQDVLFDKDIVDSTGDSLTSGGTEVPYFFSGDEIRFTLTVNNIGDDISGIVVDDIWPDVDQHCVAYSGWESMDAGWSWDNGTWRWRYTPTLLSHTQTTVTLIGAIVGGHDCVGTYINTGLLYYYQDGTLFTGEDEAIFEIRDNNMLLEKTVDATDVAVGSEVTFSLYFENNGTNVINNFVLTDMWPATLALQPSLSYPKPYDYSGPGNPSFTPPQPITGGWLLQWNWGNQEILPGETGMIVLTGVVLDAGEAIELYETSH